jgi:hypothetical protein
MNTTDTHDAIRHAIRSQAERIESNPPPLHQIRYEAQMPSVRAGSGKVPTTRPGVRVGLVVGLGVLAVGGAVAAVGNPWPRAADYRSTDRSPELANAVSDKQVTFEEYKDGFERYRRCVAAAGEPLADVHFDDATSLFTASTSGTAVDEDCYVKEWYAVDVAWQLDPSRPGFVQQPSARLLLEKACAAGGPVPGFPYSGQQLQELCDRLRESQSTEG